LPIPKGLPSSLVQLRTAVWTGVTRDTMPLADVSRCGKTEKDSLNHLVGTQKN